MAGNITALHFGRDAYIARKAKEISGKEELVEALFEAIKILNELPEEKQPRSDMADMEQMWMRYTVEEEPADA